MRPIMVNNLKKFGIAGLVVVGLLMLMVFSTGCVNNSGGTSTQTCCTNCEPCDCAFQVKIGLQTAANHRGT